MIHHGDCIEVMAGMADASVDAVVTDPPYGLEFMGKSWDRLGDVGTTSHSGPAEVASGERGQYGKISYGGSANKKCRVCGKWAWDYPERKCVCETPDFPSVVNHQSRLMQAWHEAWAREAFRVAKPGAYLLAFGGSRTVHRLASAIEDAGWEIRDELIWVYASGFPKSLDVSKALDKAAGAEREDVLEDKPGVTNNLAYGSGLGVGIVERRPVTDLAKQWEGWGTALKPAHEPIVMARKPLIGSVAANVTRYSTGALNIGATRIPGTKPVLRDLPDERVDMAAFEARSRTGTGEMTTEGRWPSNLLLSDPELFDVANPGVVGSGAVTTSSDPGITTARSAYFGTGNQQNEANYVGDSGGYSRFFLIPKADRRDREPVLRDAALLLHRERGECDKLGAWQRPDPSLPEQTDSSSPARAISDEPTTDDSNSDTSLPGKLPTDPSQPDTRSTTSTATSRTTDSTTSSSLTPPPTSDSIQAVNSETGNGGSPAESAGSSSLWGESIGISAPKAGPFMVDAVPATSAKLSKRNRCGDCGKPLPRVGVHPTTKPTDLMRHLIRLVTPIGGTVLDPFGGSGTTAVAAELEGFDWILVEREAEYVAIAEARLNGVQRGLGLDVPAPTRKPPNTHPDLAKHQPKDGTAQSTWFTTPGLPEEAA